MVDLYVKYISREVSHWVSYWVSHWFRTGFVLVSHCDKLVMNPSSLEQPGAPRSSREQPEPTRTDQEQA